ncbi:GDP-mannose 4,6-dehydratase [Candidatus Dojkabacteria bacterium]|jgi:dTDP-glucose 4,6-dehydratase|nr:GDP-mannose 4,6-dehydratase [Candidatus Dojkabacteria bacterium]
MSKRILLTGISGFVGSHLMSHLLKNTDYEIVGIASWRHKGMPTRVAEDENYKKDINRVKIITHDLQAPITPDLIERIGKVDVILNLASDSHVDRSITDPVPFVMNNVSSTLNMLEFARICKPELFIQFSTDEVYGQAKKGEYHKEWDAIKPSNPYSASKASQEAIAVAYWRTYSVPLIITNTMNIYGQYQDKEKFVPLVIDKIMKGETVYIHGYPDKKEAGTRFYLHARNIADAITFMIENVEPKLYPEIDRPERFNVVGEVELDNLTLAQKIAELLGKKLKYEIVSFHASRPGHDLRYALDGKKLQDYGHKYPVSFEDSLKATVEWYKKQYE